MGHVSHCMISLDGYYDPDFARAAVRQAPNTASGFSTSRGMMILVLLNGAGGQIFTDVLFQYRQNDLLDIRLPNDDDIVQSNINDLCNAGITNF